MLTLSGVVEVLVDKLKPMSAHMFVNRSRNNCSTHVVGGLAQVTESRDGEGEGAVDIASELLGAAVRLGDVGGERGRHFCGLRFVDEESG
jgi:hypothetical protein